MQTVKLQLEELICPSCIRKIEGKLSALAGVEKAAVLFHSSKVKITFQEGEVSVYQLAKTIEQLGYRIITSSGAKQGS